MCLAFQLRNVCVIYSAFLKHCFGFVFVFVFCLFLIGKGKVNCVCPSSLFGAVALVDRLYFHAAPDI